MAKATESSLTTKERALVAETRREHLATLDEDSLAELHLRVRRARDKFVQQHRREVAAHVSTARARGKASTAPRRSASKAEIFEDALARVSSALAKAARASASALRAERLDAAAPRVRPAATLRAASSPSTSASSKPSRARTTKTPARRKQAASYRAEGARRQAKSDAR